jgi:hypothetical protein
VQGHFSDSRSTTCRLTLQGESIGDGKVDNAAAEQWCRARFVVDSFSVIP